MSTQNPSSPNPGTKTQGLSISPAVMVNTNEPVVIMSIGSSSYRLTPEVAMHASSDLCAAANMASLQSVFRQWLENHGASSTETDKMIEQFKAEVMQSASSLPHSDSRVIRFGQASEGDS